MSAHPTKIHPLVAAAAGSVIVISLVGTAAIMDWLPGSNGEPQTSAEVAAASQTEAASAKPTQAAPAAAPQKSAPATTQRKPAPAAPASASQHAAQPMPPVAAAAPVCEACGRVEGVRTVEVEAKPSGVGVVAGAVVGGLLGNQVGGGKGKTLATVAGAVGGGYAGNEIEKRARKDVMYDVDVRMENGQRHSFRYEAAPPWHPGDRVRVVNGALAAR